MDRSMLPYREALFALFLLACGGGGMPGSIGVIAKREGATGRVIVVDVPSGGAGARAGLEKGDEILSVDGVSVYKMTRNEFTQAVRGPIGSKVTLEIYRDGLKQTVVVERAEIRAIEK
jgi:C-terminal processing protease CtpA/Prc